MTNPLATQSRRCLLIVALHLPGIAAAQHPLGEVIWDAGATVVHTVRADSEALTAVEPARRRKRRVSVVLETGQSFSGLGDGLARQFRRGGYGDFRERRCLVEAMYCSGGESYPVSKPAGRVKNVRLRYALASRLDLSASYGSTLLGGARGHRATGVGEFVSSTWSTSMMWATASIKPLSFVRVGGGPGRYELSNHAGARITRSGYVAELGLESPAERRPILSVAFRRHYIASRDIIGEPLTLRPEFSHSAVVAGFGYRF